MGRHRAKGNERLGEHLQRKAGGIIELRFPIPADVRHAFVARDGRPKKLFIQSMGTTDVRLANDRADPIRAEIKQKIARARSIRTGDELPDFLRRLYALESAKAENAVSHTSEIDRRRALVGLDDPAERQDGTWADNVVQLPVETPQARLVARLSAAARATLSRGENAISGRSLMTADPEEKLAKAGWAADTYFHEVLGSIPAPESEEYQEVLNHVIKVLQDAHFLRMDLEAGEKPRSPLHESLTEARVSADGNTALTSEGDMRLSRYYAEVFEPALKASRRGTGERYFPERAFAIQQFVELQGDKRIFAITKDDVWQFHDKLRRMPSKSGLQDGWRNKDAATVLAAVDGGAVLGSLMNAKTVNKRLSAISTLLRHAEQRRHIKMNVAEKVRAEVEDEEETGRSFSVAELNRIFAQPLFTGSRDGLEKRGLLKPGPVMVRDDRYWIPLTLFLTGARSSEIVGLDCEDVDVHAEVPHFLIVPNAHRGLKNPASRRVVPMHPYLLEAGFPEFVRRRKETGGRLFPMAEQLHYHDRRTGAATPKSLSNATIMRQFNRSILARAEATSDRGSVKCFRNTFEEEALVKVREEELRLRLTGRMIKNSSRVYKSAIPSDPVKKAGRLRVLYDAVRRMTFDGVDLSHIRAGEGNP